MRCSLALLLLAACSSPVDYESDAIRAGRQFWYDVGVEDDLNALSAPVRVANPGDYEVVMRGGARVNAYWSDTWAVYYLPDRVSAVADERGVERGAFLARVIAHEYGHGLGLPHMSGLMSAHVEGRCIDPVEVADHIPCAPACVRRCLP